MKELNSFPLQGIWQKKRGGGDGVGGDPVCHREPGPRASGKFKE